MPVKDHPRYEEWLEAANKLNAAEKRARIAQESGAADAAWWKREAEIAQEAYDKISTEIG